MAIPTREIVATYTLGNLPGYGNVMARLSETIYSRSTTESMTPEWIPATLDADGAISVLWPITDSPDIYTASGEPPYMRVIENVGRSSPRPYKVEVPDDSGPMDLNAAPHLNDGSQNYAFRDIVGVGPVMVVKDKGIATVFLENTGAPVGTPLTYIVLDATGRVIGGQYIEWATAAGLLAEQSSRIQDVATLTMMLDSLLDPDTGLIPDLRSDLTAESAARTAGDAALQTSLTAETTRAEGIETGLSQRQTSVEAALAAASGLALNLLADTYATYITPGVDFGSRSRWYNPSNVTRSVDPNRSPFNQPTLIIGTAAADGGEYEYLDEMGVATTDAISIGASVKAASGSAQLGIIWYDAAGAQGAATYGPSQVMDGTVKRLVLENVVPTNGSTIKAAIFVHRASGSAAIDLYDLSAKKGTTAPASPLPSSFPPSLLSDIFAARGSAATLDARLDATLDEDGSMRPTDAYLKWLVDSDGWELSGSGVYTGDDFDHGNIRYTDGASGVVQVDSRNEDTGAIEGAHWTYLHGSYSKTITRPTSGWSYNASGNLTAQPALTVV